MFKGRNQPKSVQSWAAKLNEDKVEEIYIEVREGTSYKAIAEMFDVSFATIQNVNSGKYFRIPDIIYPIVDRRHEYGKEPGERDDFWNSYISEPMLTRNVKKSIHRPDY